MQEVLNRMTGAILISYQIMMGHSGDKEVEQKKQNKMANKMSICIIKYTYTQYAGVDIEKYTRGLFEYVKEAFGEFQPEMSEPGTIPDMPDYLDILLCKKDGSIFYESDILRRAVNIPHDCQMDGLVLEIFIQNCDGTRYKKRLANGYGS